MKAGQVNIHLEGGAISSITQAREAGFGLFSELEDLDSSTVNHSCHTFLHIAL